MARQAVELHSKSFKSKSEATAYFKGMLNRYQNGEELNPDDDTLLFELLQRHPEANEKIGIGVKRFYRERSPIHPTSCFHIERTDGTTTDFSYTTCISGTATTAAQQFYEGCRYAVADELIHQKNKLFKDAGGTIMCKKTGIELTNNEAEYRHTSPKFREIVRDFIADHNITITPAHITHGSDMQYIARLADPKVEHLFRKYHATKAHLAIFKKYER